MSLWVRWMHFWFSCASISLDITRNAIRLLYSYIIRFVFSLTHSLHNHWIINKHIIQHTIYHGHVVVSHRCATGESWQSIMLSCTSGKRCDDKTNKDVHEMSTCGSDLAYSYFVTFIFFCSFLVTISSWHVQTTRFSFDPCNFSTNLVLLN